MAPQIIILSLVFAGLLLTSYKHGQPREGKHNIWIQLIVVACELILLYWGGFFDVWK